MKKKLNLLDLIIQSNEGKNTLIEIKVAMPYKLLTLFTQLTLFSLPTSLTLLKLLTLLTLLTLLDTRYCWILEHLR